MAINLLSANHGNAWNVLVGGVTGVGRGWSIACLSPCFSQCSLAYVWSLQEKVMVVLYGYLSFIWRGLRPNSSLYKVGLVNRQFVT